MNMRFLKCLQIVLGNEGGLSDNPSDRGGRTNYGVTQKTYSQWLKAVGLPVRAVDEIQPHEVEAIYFNYWKDAHCAYMPEQLDLQMFDAAINHGPKRAIKLLQAALGVDEDGICGRLTMTALHEEVVVFGIKQICERYLDERASFFDTIVMNDPSQAVFADGWLNRVEHMRGYA
jgi:lysozyme family protein